MELEDPTPDQSIVTTNSEIAAPDASAHTLAAQPDPLTPAPIPPVRDPWETRAALWVFWGPNKLRAGWSIAAWILILALVGNLAGLLFVKLHLLTRGSHDMTPRTAFFGEMSILLGIVIASAIVALVERRRGNLLAYNLLGPRRTLRFVEGLVAGFIALSLLVAGLYAGHWLTFGGMALSGPAIAKYAAEWALAFMAVAFVEEGMFRCYLQATFTRGLNFWWALGIVAIVCGLLLWRGKGNGVWGVYLMALLGLLPCFWLHQTRAAHSGFWQATWVTSTLFGYVHTSNNGENWIGIFAAAAIGLIFCVSVYVTGSAWWAIGCHAAWDWAETYFYGTADSGNVGPGHLLKTAAVGNPLWSGGADGPEGSVLVLGVILLLLLALIVLYRRPQPVINPTIAAELAA